MSIATIPRKRTRLKSIRRRVYLDSVELWRVIPGWEGSFEVSSWGRVRSLQRYAKTRKGFYRVKPRFMKIRIYPGRYPTVSLGDLRRGYFSYAVHRLELGAFVGLCPLGREACHVDDIKSNNLINNLYWGTKEENTADRLRNGKDSAGVRNGYSILTDSDVISIRGLYAIGGTSYRKLARTFGLKSAQSIANVVKGKQWAHVSV